jgi:hypothetical protein
MAFTYLQLANRVLKRLNEVQLNSGTFASAVGFQSAVLDNVNDSLNDIYGAELNWPYLFATTTLTTSAYTQLYNLPVTYTQVDWNSFFRQPNLTNVNPVSTLVEPIQACKMKFLSYQDWADNYQADDATIIQSYTDGITPGIQGQGGPPTMVFQTPDRLQVGISTPPDVNIYTISYNYWVKPTDLVASTDIMLVPDRYAKVVVDGATYYTYMFRDNVEEAAAIKQHFESGVAAMRRELINKQDYMRSDSITQSGLNSMAPF